MKYWILKVSKNGLAVSADVTRDFRQQTLFADTTAKGGEVEGSLKEDFPFFAGEPEEIMSRRLAAEILKLDPEGIIVSPMTLKLPDGTLNDNWCAITVSAHVDCIDFDASLLRLDEEDGTVGFIRKMVLDTKKADRAGYEIFRLQDFFPQVVVSDRLKQAMEAIKPIGIRFESTDPSEQEAGA